MRKAIVIEINKNHFDFISKEIEKLYDPFNFLFIGPTGFYVRQISDKFAKNIGKTINKNAFMVINQYVTEMLLKNNMEAVYFDRDFFKAFISEKIEELISKHEKNKDHYYEFLRVVSRSKGIIEYLLDLFEKAWELNNSTSTNIPLYYKEIENILNQDGNLPRLLKELLEEISLFFQKSENIFDPITTYKWYIENADFIEYTRENLVISGFFDLTPLVKKTLEKLFNKSKNVYFYIWRNVEDRAFKELEMIYEFLKENGFEIPEKEKGRLNIKQKTEAFSFKNPTLEIKNVCGMVKKLIINGVNPGDISIIAPTTQIMLQVSEELKDMYVPHKLSGVIKLSDSKIVKMLLQPLKTIFSGYEMEEILALIESPFLEERRLTMDQIEELFREFDFFALNIKPSDISREFIKQTFLDPIQEKIDKLSQIDEEDTYQERLEKIEEYKNFKTIIEKAFEILLNIENNKNHDFLDWLKNFVKNTINNLSLFKNYQDYLKDESVNKEINALMKFAEVITKLQKFKDALLKNKKMSWYSMYKILVNILNVETFRTTSRYSNSVEILDITTARFIEKKYKFFVHFTDSYYPSFNINPLILQVSGNSQNFAKFVEEMERRNLLLSLVFSQKNVVTYPNANFKGEPLLPSQYLKELITSKVKVSNEDNILPKPNKIFSIQDKEIYEALQKREKLLETTPEDWIGTYKENVLSHSKISTYVNCPFYFYLREIGKVRPTIQNKEAMYKGILYHRVLKEIFENNLLSLKEDTVEIIKKLVEKEYDNIFRNNIEQYRLPKELKINEFTTNITNFISENLSEKGYINITKKFTLHRKKTKEVESQYKTTLSLNGKMYKFEVRIDRIDELDKNYGNIEGKNATEVQKNITLIDKKAIAIIDYKSSLSKIYAEQLLLYDLVYRKFVKNDFDSYLIFFNLSNKSPKSYFIKREDDKLILKGSRGTKYFTISYKYFEEWLKNIIDKLSSGYFVPITIEKEETNIKPFLNYIKEITSFEIKTTAEKKCLNFNLNCDFADICKNFEIYKGINLKK
ncbi:MAG: PD-(D/E)XK nuclease family protein [Thermosipho sp. (in: Bacteria)]|nr:PD-(D/E)XK nuclease family protein [Thermosipho sp. (in: thermotogales)]